MKALSVSVPVPAHLRVGKRYLRRFWESFRGGKLLVVSGTKFQRAGTESGKLEKFFRFLTSGDSTSFGDQFPVTALHRGVVTPGEGLLWG